MRGQCLEAGEVLSHHCGGTWWRDSASPRGGPKNQGPRGKLQRASQRQCIIQSKGMAGERTTEGMRVGGQRVALGILMEDVPEAQVSALNTHQPVHNSAGQV